VTVALGVPEKVITPLVPEQIVALPEIVAVGNGFIVTVAEPDSDWLQFGVPFEATLTRVYVLLAVSTGVVTVPDPSASRVTVAFGPVPAL